MGTQYASVSISGFNSSPPSDDGAQTASNLITWDKQKTKLADPLKTAIESINAALVAWANISVRQITTSDSTALTDNLRCVEIAPTVTTAVTVSLGDAATMTTSYRVFVKNSSAINQTLGRVTVGDTIDGTAANVTLAPGESRMLQTNSTPNGYLTAARFGPFIDTNPIAVGSADGTKKFRVEVDGNTTGTTRVGTPPDYDFRFMSQTSGADIASAATVNLDTATGDFIGITGTTTITAITLADGKQATVVFAGALTLTHNANILLPGAASITTANGDRAIFRGHAGGIVRCITYIREDGNPATTTGRGVVELATGAETMTGTDAVRAVTPAGLASSQSIAASGYMKFAGGLIIQWGSGSTAAGGSLAVTFPLAFPTALFSVLINPNSSTTVRFGAVSATPTTSGFTAVVWDSTFAGIASPFSWIAVGN